MVACNSSLQHLSLYTCVHPTYNALDVAHSSTCRIYTNSKAQSAPVHAKYLYRSDRSYPSLLSSLVFLQQLRQHDQPFHPVCLSTCSSFSFLGSGSMVRLFRFSSRRSRAICLACFVVGRRMAQFSCPRMLVLRAERIVSTA
jgi:hypothetical protein